MKHLYLLVFAFICSFFIAGCIEDPEMDTTIKNGGKPEIAICSAEELEITARSVALSATIVSENGVPVVERGFCWGMKGVDENKLVVDKKGKGDFKATIDNLKNDVQYVICAYATTANGKTMMYYSSTISFTTTKGLGIVKNSEPKDVRATTAVCGGKITKAGEGEISDQGVYLSTPTVKDSLVHGVLIGTDSIACQLTNLDPETKYSTRVYVKNTYGEFSDVESVTFTTGDGRPSLVSLTQLEVRYTEADFSATIKDDGDAPILACGFCYNTNEKELPTIESDTIACERVDNQFKGTLTDLKSQQVYYVRAYVTNKFGTSYDSETTATQLITVSNWPTVSTDAISELAKGSVKLGGKVLAIGNSDITLVGVCWSTTPTPTVDHAKQDMTYNEDSTFSGVISGLQGGRTYYVRAYAKNNEAEYAYGPEINFTTPSVFRAVAPFTGAKRWLGSPAACSQNGTAYLLGGDLSYEYTKELWAYNAAEAWSQLLPFPGDARKWQTVIGMDNQLCVFGGIDKEGKRSKELHAYNITNNLWTPLSAAGGPDPVAQVAGCNKEGTLYFIGGIRDTLSSEVWKYNIRWSKADSLPQRQSGGIAVVVGDVIYAGLGFTATSGTQATKKFWSTSDATSWKAETDMPASAAIVRAGVAYEGYLHVIDDNGKIWKYDPAFGAWTSSLSSCNQAVLSMYVLDGMLHILGVDSKLMIYDPSWDN